MAPIGAIRRVFQEVVGLEMSLEGGGLLQVHE